MGGMPAADLRVLGPVEGVGYDGPIPLAGKHARLLAALLVVEGRACDFDELIEALWGDSAPASARKLVQVYVSQLRRVLPEGIGIETRQGAYAASLLGGVLDADRFERQLGESIAARDAGNAALALSLADRALGLWRGRAYGELAYEDFARAESERLEELRLAAIEERFAALLELGRVADVLGDVLAHAEGNALRERSHELAMLALYRAGRQADALEHLSAYRMRLDEELGLEPGHALRELQRRILVQDPELDVAGGVQALSTLPVPPNPLVGRAHELKELRSMLERRDSRLVVLTGAGGSGKTRLALEVAREVVGSYANGVVLVELAPLRDPALVVPTIAQALGVSVDADVDPLETVADAVGGHELLLLVDNAEHVRQAAPAYAELVARVPRLTLLVTSRAVLHVSGEHVFPVAPLDEDDAVELFTQRARLLDPSFELVAENDEDVRGICRGVDGLPLAIELAAARIRTLTPRALMQRLDARLSVLTGGPRDLPARQRTLRETIDWSVGLLDESARAVFARLAVFPAGARLDAAEAVCGAELDTLAALIDDHLVRRIDATGDPRFGMLETVREYALELLGDERAESELALAEYFAQTADDLRLSAPAEGEWRPIVERLDPEVDNLRVGLGASALSGDTELQVRLAGGLWQYWWARGPASEGLEWIAPALAAGDGPATAARAHALHRGASLTYMRGDLSRARELAEAALEMAIEARSKWDEGSSHTVLGIVARKEGDLSTARRHYLRSIELREELGIEPVHDKMALGVVALQAGAYAEAKARFEEVLEAHRRDDNHAGMGFAHLNLGLAFYESEDHGASRHQFEEAHACLKEVGIREPLAYALQGIAATDTHATRFEAAAQLLGRARVVLDDLGLPEDGFSPDMLRATKEQLREALGDEAFEAAYDAGFDGV